MDESWRQPPKVTRRSKNYCVYVQCLDPQSLLEHLGTTIIPLLNNKNAFLQLIIRLDRVCVCVPGNVLLAIHG